MVTDNNLKLSLLPSVYPTTGTQFYLTLLKFNFHYLLMSC